MSETTGTTNRKAGIGRKSGPSPVVGSERVLALDVLRGFGVLGILLVNILLFSGAQGLYALDGYAPPLDGDDIAGLFIAVFAEGKFVNTLAFLFGAGFTWQAVRAESRGYSSGRLLLRRVLVLGLFGIIHAVFIWSGDILLNYALLGLVLVLFRKCAPRTLMVWAGWLIGVMLALTAFSVLIVAATSGFSGGSAAQGGGVPFFDDLGESARQAYNSGSYPQVVLQRLRELAVFLSLGLAGAPALLAMMLAGAAVARSGWLEDLASREAGIRRAVRLGIGTGLPLNLLYGASLVIDPSGLGAAGAIGVLCWFAGAPLLAVGYMASLTLLALRVPATTAGRNPLRPVAAVGRLALSNYLAQSLVMTAIFYGLAIYGQVELVTALLIAIALLAVQLILSPIYLKRFTYGPVEWLWRRLTYGSWGS